MVFKSSGFTQKEFGSLLGRSQNQISTILNGKSNVSADMIQLMRYKLNVNPEFLLKGRTPMFLEKPKLDVTLIPILGYIPAGSWEDWIKSLPVAKDVEYLSIPYIKQDRFFGVQVKGDSMEPVLHDTDILIIDPKKKHQHGIAVVRHDLKVTIRNVQVSKNKYYLWPYNPSHKTEEIVPDEFTRLFVPIKVISMWDL